MLPKEIKTINGVIKAIYQAVKQDLEQFCITEHAEITSIEFIPSTKHVVVNLYDTIEGHNIDWVYDYETFANLPLKM